MIHDFFFGVMVLALGIAIGYGVAPRSAAEGYRQEVYATINGQRSQLPFVARAEFREILKNNCRVAASIEFGFITFGLFGAGVLLINGIKMGILYRSALVGGVYWKLWLSHVIPHGILEYIGLLLAEIAAIEGGRHLWTRLNNRTATLTWRKIVLVALACYPIILIAALIEVYVTPFL